MNIMDVINDVLSNQINQIFVGIILFLALLDIIMKKDLKGQIVSIGVLGTFIGIFIGLQDFNPEDMKHSINNILIGLKTAFFTSIVGMITAITLEVFQRLFSKNMDNSNSDERILLEISEKLNNLENLDASQDTDKIIGELERIRTVQTDTRDATGKISISIDELRDNSNRENQELITILNTNFNKMNHSLELAIEKLSKGATEEIINALKQVIEEFNQELQSQFGENFVKLNESVINLVEWQNNYKTHIEILEERLQLSSQSIEKSKESLEIISSKNEDILNVYQELKHIIDIYDKQIKELNQHLETYSSLSSGAEEMFSSITNNIGSTKEEFISLSKVISATNEEQKNSFIQTTTDIKQSHSDLTEHIKEENNKQKNDLTNMTSKVNQEFNNLTDVVKTNNEEQKNSFIQTTTDITQSYSDLTEHIKNEHYKQKENTEKINKMIANDLSIKTNEIKLNFDNLTNSFEKNKQELDLVSNHFKALGEQIPKALQVSLEELNRGLTSLTTQFQKDYKDVMDKYRGKN